MSIFRNMGPKFVVARGIHEFSKRLGIFRLKFPTTPSKKEFITLANWRKSTPPFFIESRESLSGDFEYSIETKARLQESSERIKKGLIPFFSHSWIDLGLDYDWVTNPKTSYRYNSDLHFSKIGDYNKEAGDIKYVWEKSRFSWVYFLIRNDHANNQDSAAFVFDQIEDWIEKNPLNKGPNFVCSQETSLRIFNWTFGLYFYKNSEHLSEKLFEKIINSIYDQLGHVRANINFSMTFVRNNHAMTENLALVFSKYLFPFFKESEAWHQLGKTNLLKETNYQIYDDGTYLQFSMNYHRIVVQLYTWYFNLARLHHDQIDASIEERLRKSLDFLYHCQNLEDGRLVNYGFNDGALFFPLASTDFQDFRPQLNALYHYFHGENLYGEGDWNEELYWLTGEANSKNGGWEQRQISSYDESGYYIARKNRDSFVFLRCGNHPTRPAQADNLHLDFWYKGDNILFDGGTYNYNTDQDQIVYFWGTESHNTVMVNGMDQMKKRTRFIWEDWTYATFAGIKKDSSGETIFEGEIKGFHTLGDVSHKRKVRVSNNFENIEVEDWINSEEDYENVLLWHHDETLEAHGFEIRVFNDREEVLDGETVEGKRSLYYGTKESSIQLEYRHTGNYFKTIISKKSE